MGDPSAVQPSPLERIGAICRAFRIDSLIPQLKAGEEILSGGGVVDVAVLGQFKAGKSSFLNSVIGHEIIPVDVLPATAVVTRIGYGPMDRTIVRDLAGHALEVPLGDLADYVTEQRNPENVKQVAIVDVELPTLAPFKGIRFVDTPGLGSIFAHNTRISMEWLPRVGGAIVAVSVNHPFSEQDLSLLGAVARHTPEVAILLTKADLVSESQLDVVVEFTRRQIVRHTGRELPIFPYSVQPAYGRLRDPLRDYLLRDIALGRERKFREIVSHKMRSLISDCRDYLRLAQGAAEAAESARQDLKEALRREDLDGGSVRSEVWLFAHDLKSRVRTTAGERFHAYHGEVSGRLGHALREEATGWKGNLARTTRDFQVWLASALEEELGRVSTAGEGILSGFLGKARTSLQRMVRAFQDRLAKDIERALHMTFGGARFHAEIREPERPDIRVGRTFDTNVDLLWFLIPMRVVRPVVNRHFLRLLPWETEKNLSRLAGQWADAVNASIDDLARQALDFMRNELSTIEGLISSGGDRRQEIRKALEDLDALDRAAFP